MVSRCAPKFLAINIIAAAANKNKFDAQFM